MHVNTKTLHTYRASTWKTFYIVLNTQLIALEASLFSYQCFYIILLSIPSIVIIIPFPIHQYWRNWRQRNNVEYYGLKNWNGMKTQHSSILHSLLVAVNELSHQTYYTIQLSKIHCFSLLWCIDVLIYYLLSSAGNIVINIFSIFF